MTIDALVAAFEKLPGKVVVGRGPRHPAEPNTTYAKDIAEYFNTYRQLRADAGYVSFIETYGGATHQYEVGDVSVNLTIWGFSDVSMNMDEDETAIVSEDGFLLFADAVVANPSASGNAQSGASAQATPATRYYSFCFRLHGDALETGIYCQYTDDSGDDTGFKRMPTVHTFADWLTYYMDNYSRSTWPL